ncbi:MAG: hypothetical protein KAZ58_02540 [Arenimonas sp.]|jgi:histidinol-phosphate/aromatic aminotransferase/cobyric acid decarboxylase-like protein|nr:hypothetical protein [Arenimonas sp.]
MAEFGGYVSERGGCSTPVRTWLAEAFRSIGSQVLPPQTVLLVHFRPETIAIEQALFERGVIAWPMPGHGLGECLRITGETHPENQGMHANLKVIQP